MKLQIPESLDECLYFTNRDNILAWVYRQTCPKCKKAKMSKPVEKGKVKTKAKEYVCPNCRYTEEKVAHEDSLILEAHYTCPKCKKEGESTGQYKRKLFRGVPSYIVECQHCGEKIPLTKKLKSPKNKSDVDER